MKLMTKYRTHNHITQNTKHITVLNRDTEWMTMRGFTHNTHYTEHTKTKVTESYKLQNHTEYTECTQKIIPTLNHRIHTLHRIIDLLMQKKKSTKIHRILKLWFFCKDIPTNTQNHKAYVKKKKQRSTEKRNHTWYELGHDSSSGVKEGGTGLLDLDSRDRMHKKKQIIPALNHRIHTTRNNIFINAKKKINQNTQNAQTRIC